MSSMNGRDIGAHAGARVTLAAGFDPTLARLVPHVDRRDLQPKPSVSSEPARTEPPHSNASAPWLPPMTSIRIAPLRSTNRLAGASNRADVLANWIANRACFDAAAEAAGKRFQHFTRQVRQAAVCETRDCVLLMNEQRPACQPRRHATGARDKSTQTDDNQGRCRHMTRNAWANARASRNGAASRVIKPLPRNPPTDSHSIWNALRRDDASFEAALGSQPDDLKRLGTQQARQRQRRKDVTAGAAGHDQDGACVYGAHSLLHHDRAAAPPTRQSPSHAFSTMAS